MPADVTELYEKAKASHRAFQVAETAYNEAVAARRKAFVALADAGESVMRIAKAMPMAKSRADQIITKGREQ